MAFNIPEAQILFRLFHLFIVEQNAETLNANKIEGPDLAKRNLNEMNLNLSLNANEVLMFYWLLPYVFQDMHQHNSTTFHLQFAWAM